MMVPQGLFRYASMLSSCLYSFEFHMHLSSKFVLCWLFTSTCRYFL